MRISDEDRQRVVDELARHLASGRIGFDEYSDRVEEAFAAETLAEADHARRDLPFMRLELPAGAGGGQGRVDPTGAPVGWWRSRVVLALTAVLILAAVVVALVAQAAWVALLVGGWLLGVVQGRAARARR